jgi:hypothetical protein
LTVEPRLFVDGTLQVTGARRLQGRRRNGASWAVERGK